MTTDKIEMKLVKSNSLGCAPCSVCGGYTEMVYIWCEAEIDNRKIRVCETCLQEGNIDERLRKIAEGLERHATHVRSLIGRLIVPTWAEWKAAEKKADDVVEVERLYWVVEERQRRRSTRSFDSKIPFPEF